MQQTVPLNFADSTTVGRAMPLTPRAAPRPLPRPLPRRVLFLDHTAKMGGGEIALLNLIRHLDRGRYVPSVALFSDGPLAVALREAGVETFVLPLSADVAEARKDALGGRSVLRLKSAAAAVGFVRRLARFLSIHRPDLVHCNSLKSDLLGGVAARLARVPVLWHVRDRIAEDYLPPKVVRLFRFMARRLPHYLIANSDATLRTLQIDSNGRLRSHLRVVHDGTPQLRELSHAADRAAEEGAGPTAPLVGLVGRITRWKGQHVFLRAAARVLQTFPQARFQVIGSAMFDEADYEQEVRDLAGTLGIADRVEFTGFRADAQSLIQRLDVLVHASTTGEPFGQVIIEAMAAGKPVVATNGGGVPEIVRNGVTGLLVPMGDDAAMAAAVSSLLSDPPAACRMGRRGWERVRDRFTMERVATEVQQVYDEMIYGNSTAPQCA